ncbi:hypothetical protein FGO68_gene8694 [Halteria grandinella]|uniref:CWH43-like N-terminal domain-containing protein n=1 Tax=Halteria grandinella TaxID=5974 RepID=A0A8J8NNF5_HALGN|nr:hypothetical protein FGO68_gene8694 [Halteria grandinella]
MEGSQQNKTMQQGKETSMRIPLLKEHKDGVDGQEVIGSLKRQSLQSRSKESRRSIKWLKMEERTGVWGFGLTQITISLVIIIQISFAIMLYVSCSYGFNECSWTAIPMISDVIRDPMFDRIFILLNTSYFIGIHQVNVRALYSRFHGIISHKVNDILFYAGMASSFSLPLIGFFDNRHYNNIHNACAGVFFLSSAIYLSLTAILMFQHKEELIGQYSHHALNFENDHTLETCDTYSQKILKRISFNYRFSHVCSSVMIALFASVGVFGQRHGVTAMLEWVGVFSYMTLTMLIMSVIPCYEPSISRQFSSDSSKTASSSEDGEKKSASIKKKGPKVNTNGPKESQRRQDQDLKSKRTIQ